MKLNKDQTLLLKSMFDWWASDRQFFVLSGQAGVGKTTCMRFFKGLLQKQHPGIKICMSAPTNKAVSVLSDSVDDSSVTFKTTYSILGLRMQANGEVKELTDSGEERITDFDLVVIDEGSMVNTVLIDFLLKKIALSDTKIVLIGDKEQLPPVGEIISPVWTRFPLDYELTEVMRHQNSILDFVQGVRGNPNPQFFSTGDQVFVDANEDEFVEKIIKHAKEGSFHKGEAKAIAWRNVTVDFLNKIIRENNPLTNSPERYVAGDRVVFREPLSNGERTLASTDEEGTVETVEITQHTIYPTLKAWKVGIRMDWTQQFVFVYVIHESSERNLQALLDEYKQAKRWDLFWKLKEAFHNISYAYALTAHRSQGSTFQYVFVDAGDIMMNRNASERTKCLYVATSRASKELHLFP